MFCTKCGAKSPAEAQYCHECGALLTVEHLTPEPHHLSVAYQNTIPVEKSNQAPYQEPNFIIKHWQGDYSLGFSYWVIGSLLTLILAALTSMMGSVTNLFELGPRITGAAILFFYGFVITITIWQLIGIWRSADKHVKRGGKSTWAGLAKLMVVFGLLRAVGEFSTIGAPLMNEGAKLLVGIDNTSPYAIRTLRDGTELELAGGMPFGTAEAVKKSLDETPTIKVIHLNSQGGRIGEAYKLYKIIKQRSLITFTSADCVSACTIAFLAGKERYLGEHGRLGFHSTSFGNLSGEVVKELNDEVRKTLQNHGASNSFINRAMSTSPKDMWYPTKDELLKEKVIDSIVDSRYFGLSGITQWRDAHKIETELLAILLYSTLAQYDQQNYVKLRNILVAGIQKGHSLIEIQNEVRSIFIGQLIPKYIKKAPDSELIRYWRSQVDEMRYLAKLNPQSCADIAYPQFAKSEQNLQHLLSSELQKEDLDALTDVVKSASINPHVYESSLKAQADLEAVAIKVVKKYPWALDVVINPEKYKDDPTSLCAGALAVYSEILAIPSSTRSAAVLRHMFFE